VSSKAMTADQARSFDGFSEGNAMVLAMAAKAHSCSCAPYADWFTWARWIAQGRVVKKGEHGIKLDIYIGTEKVEKQDDGTEKVTRGSRPWTTTVFCRCQTQELEAKK
jgi:antirestriction protein ArdC